MNRVFISKIGITTALGDGLDKNWESVCALKSAIKPVTHFQIDSDDIAYAACLDDIHAASESKYDQPPLQRTLSQIAGIPSDTLVIWTGNSDPDRKKLEQSDYPLEKIKDYFNLDSKGLDICASGVSSIAGVILGSQLISQGSYLSVLVCGFNKVDRITHEDLKKQNLISGNICKPYDVHRDGFNLGDGCCAILLTCRDYADKYRLPIYGRISGWGISNNTDTNYEYHEAGDGLFDAIYSALDQAAVSDYEVEAVCGAGNGSVMEDEAELEVMNRIFSGIPIPAFSARSATGNTISAAGLIDLSIAVKCLQSRRIPPTYGLQNPESYAESFYSDNLRNFEGNNILSINMDRFGLNAAILAEAI